MTALPPLFCFVPCSEVWQLSPYFKEGLVVWCYKGFVMPTFLRSDMGTVRDSVAQGNGSSGDYETEMEQRNLRAKAWG